MQLKLAKSLAQMIRARPVGGDYTTEQWRLKAGQLQNFHQWADNRPCTGAFRIGAKDGSAIWIAIVDWKQSSNYYLTVFPETRAGPLAEIHQCEEEEDGATFRWTYKPTKQDGRNPERRAYFEAAMNAKEILISVPGSDDELADFFAELFALAAIRQKSDALDPVHPPSREGFPEGKRKERLHWSRERNPEVIRQAKQLALSRDGRLQCACCNFDFERAYGPIGQGFIEGHHTKPISTLHADGETTKVEDIALVCANCHRMLHRRRPWLRLGQLSRLINNDG